MQETELLPICPVSVDIMLSLLNTNNLRRLLNKENKEGSGLNYYEPFIRDRSIGMGVVGELIELLCEVYTLWGRKGQQINGNNTHIDWILDVLHRLVKQYKSAFESNRSINLDGIKLLKEKIQMIEDLKLFETKTDNKEIETKYELDLEAMKETERKSKQKGKKQKGNNDIDNYSLNENKSCDDANDAKDLMTDENANSKEDQDE
mmetsp:Transcript_63161/g.136764  ORF Transcript_63161/g.136764 Transcript_63161/m.136764 type:complete len:205 (+) Transcript_63161:1082-1696(+)